MQLRAPLGALALALALGVATPLASADGSLSFRGAYYKERSTRVQQPMVDATLDAGENGDVDLHLLVDSITSASAAAGASGGAAFTERRYEMGAGYRHAFERVRLGGGGRTSTENDYTSLFGHGRVEIDLADRNTVLSLGVAQGHDKVSNAGARGMTSQVVRGDLDTTLMSAGVTQILGERLVATVGYDAILLRGFQENAYRLVAAGGQVEPERVPDRRLRHAATGTVRGYVTPTRSTLIAAYRFYRDTWGIQAHTPEVRVVQEIGDDLDVTIGYRYYRQRAADFYREIYDSADPMIEPYLTSDVKLSRMHSHTLTGKLGLALAALGLGGARADLVVDYVRPSTYLGPAVMAQVGVTVPIAY